MGNWHKTGCVLCAQHCGLEVFTEDGRMTKVRPDYAERGAAKAVPRVPMFSVQGRLLTL